MKRNPLLRLSFPAMAIAALACSAALAMTGDSVAEPYRGSWVPAKASCDSPLKLVIDAKVVTFVNGAQRAEFKKLEQCFSCMGRDVQNMTLLSTDAMGDSPFMITLDGTKKVKPGVSVDLGKRQEARRAVSAGNAALKRCV